MLPPLFIMTGRAPLALGLSPTPFAVEALLLRGLGRTGPLAWLDFSQCGREDAAKPLDHFGAILRLASAAAGDEAQKAAVVNQTRGEPGRDSGASLLVETGTRCQIPPKLDSGRGGIYVLSPRASGARGAEGQLAERDAHPIIDFQLLWLGHVAVSR